MPGLGHRTLAFLSPARYPFLTFYVLTPRAPCHRCSAWGGQPHRPWRTGKGTRMFHGTKRKLLNCHMSPLLQFAGFSLKYTFRFFSGFQSVGIDRNLPR